METKDRDKLELGEKVEVKLVWDKPAEVPTLYANHLIISHTGSEFYLVFGEMEPWLEFDPSIVPSELKIKPIVKIAISSENMMKFEKIIAGNVKQYKDVTSHKEVEK